MIVTEFVTYRTHQVPVCSLKPSSQIPFNVKCDECGKVFTTNMWRLTRNGHELCQQCALRIKQRKDLPVGSKYGRLEVLRPSERVGFSVCRCECGNECEVNNTALKRLTTRSCGCLQSEIARHTAQAYFPHPKGSEHPNWKGGITDERHTVEASGEYKAYRRAVLERDGHKCRKCGSTSNLCVHHIRDFMSHPELRCDVDNGITLCRSCHREFHRIYGKGTKAGCGTFGPDEIGQFIACA